MSDQGVATYVYGLVESPRRPRLAGLPRLPGARPPRALPVDARLWLVAADVPLAAYGAEPLARGLRDIDWVAARAVAHQGVVAGVARSATVVPMRLFTLFASDDRAVAHVRRGRRRIDRVLARVRGAVEWGVRLRVDAEAAARAADGASRSRAGKSRPQSGTGFLEAKRDRRDASRNAARNASAEIRRVQDALAPLARASRRLPIPAAPGPRTLLLDAAFLVARKDSARFRRAVRDLGASLADRGLALALTGPWPTYNFTR